MGEVHRGGQRKRERGREREKKGERERGKRSGREEREGDREILFTLLQLFT